ncbi:hypothetical protein Q1695_006023 [Nippostrongylus brasiliensis]|nr:hypothetical protein Q1695_006023 [Nippostrongylus brasiliensis]
MSRATTGARDVAQLNKGLEENKQRRVGNGEKTKAEDLSPKSTNNEDKESRTHQCNFVRVDKQKTTVVNDRNSDKAKGEAAGRSTMNKFEEEGRRRASIDEGAAGIRKPEINVRSRSKENKWGNDGAVERKDRRPSANKAEHANMSDIEEKHSSSSKLRDAKSPNSASKSSEKSTRPSTAGIRNGKPEEVVARGKKTTLNEMVSPFGNDIKAKGSKKGTSDAPEHNPMFKRADGSSSKVGDTRKGSGEKANIKKNEITSSEELVYEEWGSDEISTKEDRPGASQPPTSKTFSHNTGPISPGFKMNDFGNLNRKTVGSTSGKEEYTQRVDSEFSKNEATVRTETKRSSSTSDDRNVFEPKQKVKSAGVEDSKRDKNQRKVPEKRGSGDSPTLEAHVRAISERRNSLPRSLTVESPNDMEIVIGEDGKPAFHAAAVTTRTEEIMKELNDALLEDDERFNPKSKLFF